MKIYLNIFKQSVVPLKITTLFFSKTDTSPFSLFKILLDLLQISFVNQNSIIQNCPPHPERVLAPAKNQICP